jgi:aspartate/methionine/tyrosine aminotransferase
MNSPSVLIGDGFEMFASRTDWSLSPNLLSVVIGERRAQGLPLLDLTESNPTHCGFSVNEQEILRALGTSCSLVYEPDPRGPLQARRAVAGYYAERGIQLHPEQIFLTTGTSEAYSYVFRLLANPGDNILTPRPSYPLFDFLARLNDLEMRSYPLIYDQGWQIDVQALARRLTARTKAVVLVHPNNPTGSFVQRKDLEFLIGCCEKQPLAIIADEVFADYSFNDAARGGTCPEEIGNPTDLKIGSARDRAPGLAPAQESGTRKSRDTSQDQVLSFAAESETLTFTLSGLSKISALPQMKLAWLIASGPEGLLRAALARLEVIADTYLSVSAPLAHALPALLELRHQVRPQILARVRRNLRWLGERLSSGGPVTRLESEGGWYVILRLPAVRTDEEWAVELLRQDGVLVHPGHFYDLPYESHLVASLLPFTEIFQQGIVKILGRGMGS